MGARGTGAMGDYATSVFVLGSATGGVVFFIPGDRIGCVKTMVRTIPCHTLVHWPQCVGHGHLGLQRVPLPVRAGRRRAVRRGVAPVAEAVPERARLEPAAPERFQPARRAVLPRDKHCGPPTQASVPVASLQPALREGQSANPVPMAQGLELDV